MKQTISIGFFLLLTASAMAGFESVRSSMPTNHVALLIEWVSTFPTETNDFRLIEVLFTPSVSFLVDRVGGPHGRWQESVTVEFSERDQNQAIEQLLLAGANPNERLNSWTVLDWAIHLRNKKIIWLLLGDQWGAKLSVSTLKNAAQTATEKNDDLVCLRIKQLIDARISRENQEKKKSIEETKVIDRDAPVP
jgi:hypothetical protein